jgi:hypothetical protein
MENLNQNQPQEETETNKVETLLDKFKKYCEDYPDADECKIYED